MHCLPSELLANVRTKILQGNELGSIQALAASHVTMLGQTQHFENGKNPCRFLDSFSPLQASSFAKSKQQMLEMYT